MIKLIKNLGRVRIVSEGEHDSTKEYKVLSKVHSNITKATYISIKDVPKNISIINTSYWDKLVDDPINNIVNETNAGLMSSQMLNKLNGIPNNIILNASDKVISIWVGTYVEYVNLATKSDTTLYITKKVKQNGNEYISIYLGTIGIDEESSVPTYDLYLDNVGNSADKLRLIEVIHNISNLSLKESKDLYEKLAYDNIPALLKIYYNVEDANTGKSQIDAISTGICHIFYNAHLEINDNKEPIE